MGALLPIRSAAQTDVYLAGMQECLSERDFSNLSELFAEMDRHLHSFILTDNVYYGFAIQYSTRQMEEEVFRVEEGSRLDSLIRVNLASGLWRKMEPVSGEDGIELVPPGGMPPPRDPSTIESVTFDPDGAFIKCSLVYTLQPALSRVYQRYHVYHVASSKVKINALLDIFREEDYALPSVQYFIALDILLQHMLLMNEYEVPTGK